jgi:dCTP deaminase
VSVLSDRDIRAELGSGRVRIDPYDPGDLQPSSVDLHLDRSFRVFRNNRYAYIDPRTPQPDLTELLTVGDDEPFVLHPGEFVLGQTIEWVELPGDLVARLEGKSSLGRLGLLIHSTAGYVDPGWKGTLTLELSNVANLPIALYAGMRIGQISFFRMSSAVDRPYGSAELGSKYQGQSEPTASAFHADFDRGRVPARTEKAPADTGPTRAAPTNEGQIDRTLTEEGPPRA